MKLGQQVLDRISNLLVQVDQPKSPKRKQNHVQYHNPDVGTQSQENRLYNNYKKMKDRIHEREREHMMTELRQMQPFRVQNKHSIFLNSKNSMKPIHQRTRDIIQQREISIEKKRMELQIERDRKKILNDEYSEEPSYDNSRSKSARKVTQSQLDEILNRLTQRERDRNTKNKNLKMNYLKSKLLNSKDKPEIDQESMRLWEKRKNQKSLSPNVFDRMGQYQAEQKKSKEMLIQRIKQNQTPFRPQLTKKTNQIAKNLSNRSLLHKATEKTNSCRCFKRLQQHSMSYSGLKGESRRKITTSRSISRFNNKKRN